MTRSARLLVETREFDAVEDLLPYTSHDAPLAWLRRGDGIVGVVEVRRFVAGGRTGGEGMPRTAALAQEWREAHAASRAVRARGPARAERSLDQLK